MGANQLDKIIRYLSVPDSYLTSRNALLLLGIYRLAARIHDLEKKGYIFGREWDSYTDSEGHTERYIKYTLKYTPEVRE